MSGGGLVMSFSAGQMVNKDLQFISTHSINVVNVPQGTSPGRHALVRSWSSAWSIKSLVWSLRVRRSCSRLSKWTAGMSILVLLRFSVLSNMAVIIVLCRKFNKVFNNKNKPGHTLEECSENTMYNINKTSKGI